MKPLGLPFRMDTVPLYSEQCLTLLRQALEREKSQASIRPVNNLPQKDDSSDSENDQEDIESSSESSSPHEDDQEESKDESPANDAIATTSNNNNNNNNNNQNNTPPAQSTKAPNTTKKPKPMQSEKERQSALKKHLENMNCHVLPIHDTEALHLSTNLLSPHHPKAATSIAERNYVPPVSPCQEYIKLCEALQTQQQQQQQQTVLVLLLRSGRFAAGIFRGSQCLVHRACQRYTVRKGQGKAQSAQDGSRRPKSMGAQLRRAGEENLQQDIRDTMQEWKPRYFSAPTKDHNKNQTCLILVSCPKGMTKYLYDAIDPSMFTKQDPRLRRLPLDVGRPTYDSVCLAYQVMMTVQIRHWSPPPLSSTLACIATEMDGNENKPQPSTNVAKDEPSNVRLPPFKKKETDIVFPLTPLHEACQSGNTELISEMLAEPQKSMTIPASEDLPEESLTVTQMINRRVGPDFWTCLHYAAAAAASSSTTTTSSSSTSQEQSNDGKQVDYETFASCTKMLLVDGKADPGIVDIKNRPPYFVAAHDKIRDAFRMARATLGEDYCAWDDAAKVGPALTLDDIQAKKEREAEKKRIKRARQKQKKAQEKAEAERDQRQREQAEMARKQEEDAKRVRDGLQPKTAVVGGTACDFCQKVVKGRKRKDMFSRLQYVYCSADCVQKHKRELMAAAALSRFGG